MTSNHDKQRARWTCPCTDTLLLRRRTCTPDMPLYRHTVAATQKAHGRCNNALVGTRGRIKRKAPISCNTLQHTATHCNTSQRTATHCNTLQRTATHCNTLQHTATHCNKTKRPSRACAHTLAIKLLNMPSHTILPNNATGLSVEDRIGITAPCNGSVGTTADSRLVRVRGEGKRARRRGKLVEYRLGIAPLYFTRRSCLHTSFVFTCIYRVYTHLWCLHACIEFTRTYYV